MFGDRAAVDRIKVMAYGNTLICIAGFDLTDIGTIQLLIWSCCSVADYPVGRSLALEQLLSLTDANY
jgi:hypothetical protein